jgi:hypothetical protein
MTDSTIDVKVKNLLVKNEKEILDIKEDVWSMLELSICNPTCDNANIKSRLFDTSKILISILDILEK